MVTVAATVLVGGGVVFAIAGAANASVPSAAIPPIVASFLRPNIFNRLFSSDVRREWTAWCRVGCCYQLEGNLTYQRDQPELRESRLRPLAAGPTS